MANLGWGKCRIFIKDLEAENAKWKEVPTPAENSTSLGVTKGSKTEAKIEGGENEDVRYNKNNYALSYTIRAAKGRPKPIADEDGIIMHKYAVAVQPEDPSVQGLMIDNSTVSVEDTFSTSEGGAWVYTHDALKATSGRQCKWGVITVTGSGDNITDVTCAEVNS